MAVFGQLTSVLLAAAVVASAGGAPAGAAAAPAGPGSAGASHRAAVPGPRVPDVALYNRLKVAANAKARGLAGAQLPAAAVATPTLGFSWEGVRDPNWTPSDSTGAIGPMEYVELVNDAFGIYDRSGTLLASGKSRSLTGATGGSPFDPQVIWDSTTNRFYYVEDDHVSSTDNELAFGFSKTSSPTSAADWCHYFQPWGTEFPDYPKLGDNSKYFYAGVNVYQSYSSNKWLYSKVAYMQKPSGTGAITTCPASGVLSLGISPELRYQDGLLLFDPTAVNQISTAKTGYIVGSNIYDSPRGTAITLLTTGVDSTGAFTITTTGSRCSNRMHFLLLQHDR